MKDSARVYFSMSMRMKSVPFITDLTPICLRSRAVQSSGGVASRYPRSSTPLRDLNTSSPTNRQEPVVQKKSPRTAVTAGKPERKHKSRTDGVRVKASKRAVSGAPASKRDAVTASTASGRKSHTDGVKEKIAKRAVSKAPSNRGNRVTASTASGHSRFIESLAGELQKQKREVVDDWCNVCCIVVYLLKTYTIPVHKVFRYRFVKDTN